MNDLKRLALPALAAAVLASTLSGCAPLMLGGAAVGTMVAVDRRTSAAQLEDETIELRAASRLGEVLGSLAHINVTSYNRQVLLTGEVPDAASKQLAEQTVTKVDNVRSVINELAVMRASSLTQRGNDVYITGKVKATLVDAKDLTATAFKVVTERGTVHLMGRVTQRESERATALVRQVSGVTRVVRAFEIISEEELARIAPKAPTPAAAPVSAAQPASAAK
ncbi:MAG: BON domain-containing protein [Ramlibacter sp.]|jgi:osmotically-inducible protein OsmY